jgi:formylglycine-generating enzyme required for sulfatase activity
VGFKFIELALKSDVIKADLADERPHQVTISKPFALGKYPVTQSQWQAVMGDNPTADASRGDNKPLCTHDAEKFGSLVDTFLERLNSAQNEYTYRLPTEAEWEYACRAGTTMPWLCDDEKDVMLDPKRKYTDSDKDLLALLNKFVDKLLKYAVYGYSSMQSNKLIKLPKETLANVGAKLPNPWGLYDMYGNVWELTQDCYAPYPNVPSVDPCCAKGKDRVWRGGSFTSGYVWCRTAQRQKSSAMGSNSNMGFRLARSPRLEEQRESPLLPAGKTKQDARKTTVAPKIQKAPATKAVIKEKKTAEKDAPKTRQSR